VYFVIFGDILRQIYEHDPVILSIMVLSQQPPWDTGVSPPELLAFVRHLAGARPGLRSTNAFPGKPGWQATGVVCLEGDPVAAGKRSGFRQSLRAMSPAE
jgi:hypothetical protein